MDEGVENTAPDFLDENVRQLIEQAWEGKNRSGHGGRRGMSFAIHI